MKTSKKITFIIILLLLFSSMITFIYTLDKAIMPRVMVTAEAKIKNDITTIINETICEEYSKRIDYNDLISYEKDEEGNITMMRADTLKLNEVAATTVLIAQKKLKEEEGMDIKIPIGQITKNNLLARFGPKVKMKVEPIGYITTKYISEFQSAGINQTKHSIYIETTTKVRLVLPFESREVEVVNQIPVVEIVIVGKVPNTAIQLDLNK